ncbi:MAG: hypothetical protein Harvfovirus32_1 [Harvfovirus sp.]|uniref:Uncharacterized protein n=1 Tax=Harvfovirus sp. TaxID=2487768 RepID=A0A3G5A2I5_9VIRU|nr:MAG: hypothetical protein Harvfovirus32_1 [Harvfovirus sp.]
MSQKTETFHSILFSETIILFPECQNLVPINECLPSNPNQMEAIRSSNIISQNRNTSLTTISES